MKVKSKNDILNFLILFLLISFASFSQEIKYNVIKEISTMEDINKELSNSVDENAQKAKEILADTSSPNISTENSQNINNIENFDIENEEEIKTEIKENIENTTSNDEKKQENINDLSPKEKKLVKEEAQTIQSKQNNSVKPEEREVNKKEEKFEEINDRTNRITALGSAMGAIDFGNIPEKKVRIGAGVGNSSSSQAVAVGVGYAPTDRFRINTKFSSSTNNVNNNSISVGASYDLDL